MSEEHDERPDDRRDGGEPQAGFETTERGSEPPEVPRLGPKTVLVTGATGYVGGRLIPRLLEAGCQVRALVREPRRAQGRSWSDQVELVEGDLLDPDCCRRISTDIDAAYYLVHSMGSAKDYAERDRRAAETFAREAREAGVEHVVYLGGLQPDGARSEHLSSRGEVGEILRDALPGVTELQAGPIIGSGSASFEMVRYLTERLPAMITPKWVKNTVQPIAIRDVLQYLLLALERGPSGVVEIGADRLTFRDMMKVYAEVRGLKRLIVPVPVLAPGLAARWVGLVTPIHNSLAVPLVRGVVESVLADTRKAEDLFPTVRPIPYRLAVELALERIQEGQVETSWSGAMGPSKTLDLTEEEGLVREVRTRLVDVSQEAAFLAFTSLGGDQGWLAWGWAWRVRGIADALIGGPGLRRGRRHPQNLYPGEAVDFWRVEEVDRPCLLRLRAEMKVPGKAWLQYEAREEEGKTRLIQAALFEPRGLPGWIYWWAMYPAHRFIFDQMIDRLAVLAETRAETLERQTDEGSVP